MDKNEILIMETFKELKNEVEKEFGPNKVDDGKIKRFLIARECNVKQAYAMLKRDLEWRKANHVDTLLEDYRTPEVFEKYMALSIIGFDKEGSIVFINDFGKMDHKGLVKAARNEDLYRHFTYLIELAYQMMSQHLKKIKSDGPGKFTFFLDMKDLKMSELTNKTVIERCIQLVMITDAHYPEMLKAVYIINTSTPFQLLYSLVKPFVAPKTLRKVKMYGKDGYKEDLLEIIDSKVLPAYLGGERIDPDGNPMCHSIMRHGTPVPEHMFLKNIAISNFKNEPGVKTHILGRRSKFDLPLQVKLSDSYIEWEFEIDSYDIEFSLFYKAFDTNEDDEMTPIIPLQKSNSHLLREKGTLKCENPGIYVLTWDNSYSYFRSKTIYYKVGVCDPDQE